MGALPVSGTPSRRRRARPRPPARGPSDRPPAAAGRPGARAPREARSGAARAPRSTRSARRRRDRRPDPGPGSRDSARRSGSRGAGSRARPRGPRPRSRSSRSRDARARRPSGARSRASRRRSRGRTPPAASRPGGGRPAGVTITKGTGGPRSARAGCRGSASRRSGARASGTRGTSTSRSRRPDRVARQRLERQHVVPEPVGRPVAAAPHSPGRARRADLAAEAPGARASRARTTHGRRPRRRHQRGRGRPPVESVAGLLEERGDAPGREDRGDHDAVQADEAPLERAAKEGEGRAMLRGERRTAAGRRVAAKPADGSTGRPRSRAARASPRGRSAFPAPARSRDARRA
jgi:hypothetical protein